MRLCWNVNSREFNFFRDALLPGNTFTLDPENSDFCFTDDLTCKKVGRQAGIGITIPKFVLNGIGYNVTEDNFNLSNEPEFAVSRYFYNGKFFDQHLLLFPVFQFSHLNKHGNGVDALGCRYVKDFELTKSLYNDKLIEFLKVSNYEGFVTFQFFRLDISAVHLGLPWIAWANFLRALDCEPMVWFREHRRLIESWTLSVVVKRQNLQEYSTLQIEQDYQSHNLHLYKHLEKGLPANSHQKPSTIICRYGRSLRDAQDSVLEQIQTMDEIYGANYDKQLVYHKNPASEIAKTVTWVKSVCSF